MRYPNFHTFSKINISFDSYQKEKYTPSIQGLVLYRDVVQANFIIGLDDDLILRTIHGN